MLGTPPNRRASAVALCLVMVLSAIYLGMNLKRGWIPWDEGILGQSAERVLNGEIPHKDFNDAYTGGLSYLDAFIFRLFGINLLYLRNFLFACFLLWVPAVYSLARDFLRPWTAGAVTLLAVAWSVPNYPAAMPSWFLLFLTTFGTLALSKYATQPKTHWLILAGLCGGLSFLFKTVGLYFIAGGLLFLVFREQDLARTETDTSQTHRAPTFVGFLILCLVAFLSCLIKLVMVPADTPEFLHYVLPSLAIASLLAVREFTPSTLPSRQRFSTLFGMAIPFLGAAALPILLCFSFYWWHGALAPFVKEVFVLALRRIQYAHLSPPGLILELPAIVACDRCSTYFLCNPQIGGCCTRVVFYCGDCDRCLGPCHLSQLTSQQYACAVLPARSHSRSSNNARVYSDWKKRPSKRLLDGSAHLLIVLGHRALQHYPVSVRSANLLLLRSTFGDTLTGRFALTFKKRTALASLCGGHLLSLLRGNSFSPLRSEYWLQVGSAWRSSCPTHNASSR